MHFLFARMYLKKSDWIHSKYRQIHKCMYVPEFSSGFRQHTYKIHIGYRHHSCRYRHIYTCMYLIKKYRHHTGSIQTRDCSYQNQIQTHSSKYMHILICLYVIHTCMYLIQTCLYDICMCMYLFAHTNKINQLVCCLYVLKNTYTYKHAGFLMLHNAATVMRGAVPQPTGTAVAELVFSQDCLIQIFVSFLACAYIQIYLYGLKFDLAKTVA
jgi:hypothetical protein